MQVSLFVWYVVPLVGDPAIMLATLMILWAGWLVFGVQLTPPEDR